MKNKKYLLIIGIPILLILVLAISCYIWLLSTDGLLIKEATYSDSVYTTAFGHEYAIMHDLYGPLQGYYAADHPSYHLSADRIMYRLQQGEKQRICGTLHPMALTALNFDRLIPEPWIGYDGQSYASIFRGRTVAAWYSKTDNRLLYILLQENGDILICNGYGEKNILGITQWKIYEIQALKRLD